MKNKTSQVKLISFVTILSAMLFAINSNAQDMTYIITSNDLSQTYPYSVPYNSTPGTYYVPLDVAIVYANTYLNATNNSFAVVRILFDVPLADDNEPTSSLVYMSHSIPDIDFVKGKIIFDVVDITGPMQGIKKDLPTSITGDCIFNFEGEKIELNNLQFESYNTEGHVLEFRNGSKFIKIEKCIFNTNCSAIDIFWVFFEECTIKDNIFSYISPQPCTTVCITNYLAHGFNSKITISGNKFYTSDNTAIFTHDYPYLNEDGYAPNNTSLTISNNIIFADVCIWLGTIPKYSMISNNNLYYSLSAFTIGHSQGIDDGGIALDGTPISFVNPGNTLGYTPTNSNNNLISNSSYAHSFDIRLNTSGNVIPLDQSNIIGYHLPHPVIISQVSNVVVRENQIENSNTHPIVLSDQGNYFIPSPVLSGIAHLENDEMIVNYTISGLNSINGPFVVDFYQSNYNNDLLSLHHSHYIGYDVSGSYQTTMMNDYYHYSMTVTSLGTGAPRFVNAIGTSEATHFTNTSYNVSISGDPCLGEDITFNVSGSSTYQYSIDGGNFISSGVPNVVRTFQTVGTHTFCVRESYGAVTQCYDIYINDCPPNNYDCENCIGSFSPVPGSEYIVGAWVREEVTGFIPTYTNGKLEVSYYNQVLSDISGISPIRTDEIYASGNIIDGWQRIDSTVIIPANTRTVVVRLVNDSPTANVYFDDIRFHPVNSSLQSYVYDSETGRLNAVNDENNYATFYEYDEEGSLVRVKKETERGIVTIQESRNTIKKGE